MIIILTFAVFGALLGALKARGRGGKALDIAQYATGYALAFGIVGLFISVFLLRS